MSETEMSDKLLRRLSAVCTINDRYVFTALVINRAMKRLLSNEVAAVFFHPPLDATTDAHPVCLKDIVDNLSKYADYGSFLDDVELMLSNTFKFCSEGTIQWGMACELQIDVDALRGFQRWINVRRHWRRLSFYGLVKALAEHRRQRRADLVLWLVLYYWHPNDPAEREADTLRFPVSGTAKGS